MSKYTDRLVKKIAALIEEDTYTISEICQAFHITRKTFYEWKDTRPEFREAIQEAEQRRDDKLLILARTSLKKKLEGYIVTEEKTTYTFDKNRPGHMIQQHKVVKTKYCPPDNAAIKMVLDTKQRQDTAQKKQAEQQAIAAAGQTKQERSKDDYLQIEFNSEEARRNYEIVVARLQVRIPHDQWRELSIKEDAEYEANKKRQLAFNSNQSTADNEKQ